MSRSSPASSITSGYLSRSVRKTPWVLASSRSAACSRCHISSRKMAASTRPFVRFFCDLPSPSSFQPVTEPLDSTSPRWCASQCRQPTSFSLSNCAAQCSMSASRGSPLCSFSVRSRPPGKKIQANCMVLPLPSRPVVCCAIKSCGKKSAFSALVSDCLNACWISYSVPVCWN